MFVIFRISFVFMPRYLVRKESGREITVLDELNCLSKTVTESDGRNIWGYIEVTGKAYTMVNIRMALFFNSFLTAMLWEACFISAWVNGNR